MNKLNPIGVIKKVFVNKIVIEIFDLSFLIQNYNGDIYEFKGLNDFVSIKKNRYDSVIYTITSLYEDNKKIIEEDNYKIENRLYFEATTLGELSSNNFNFGVNNYPMIGDEVYLTLNDELNCILGCDDPLKIKVGNLVTRKTYRPYINLDKILTTHMSILGNTGSGKSTTIRRILIQICKLIEEREDGIDLKKVNFYIFDIHDEYRDIVGINEKLCSYHNFKDLAIPLNCLSTEDWLNLLTPSLSAQLPILLTSLKLSYLIEKGIIDKNWINVFCAYNLYNSQQTDAVTKRTKILGYLKHERSQNEKLNCVLKHYDSKFGNWLGQHESNFLNELEEILDFKCEDGMDYHGYLNNLLDEAQVSVSKISLLQEAIDLVITLEESNGNNQIRGYCSTLINRIDQLRVMYNRTLFSEDKDRINNYTKLTENSEKPFKIINISENEITELLFFTSFILGQIYERQKSNRKNGDYYMYNMIFDEAHSYIREETNNIYNPISMFEKIAKEGRKFGIFMLLSSQRPSELSKTVISQCNNYILHRIRNNLDLDQIRRSVPYVSDEQISRISYLETGVGLMVGDAFQIPLEICVEGEGINSTSKTIKPSEIWFQNKAEE